MKLIIDKEPIFEGFKKSGELYYYFRGYVIWNGKLYIDEEFEPILLKNYDLASVEKFNGKFFFIIVCRHRVIIANDRYGFRPLFYTYGLNEPFVVSNRWQELGRTELREDSLTEMLAFGHVVGQKTAITGVYEIPPATYLRINNGSQDWYKYWKARHTWRGRSEEEFVGLWDEQMKIYTDYILEHGGHCEQLLSAGMDSRLIAHTLNEAGVKVTATTFGPDGLGKELLAADKIASYLKNYTWSWCCLNEVALDMIEQSEIEYDRCTGARNGEKELDLCYYGGLRVAGYSGDFVTGADIKYKTLFKTKDQIVNYICKHRTTPLIKDLPRQVLYDTLEGDSTSDFIDWNLQNRERRFIARQEAGDNDKTFALFPFYDYRIHDFFLDCSFDQLHNQKLYVNAQLKYMYKTNPAVIKVRRNGFLRHWVIRNGFLFEYFNKLRLKILRGQSIWSRDIDWQRSWVPPKYRNVNSPFVLYVLNIVKLKKQIEKL